MIKRPEEFKIISRHITDELAVTGIGAQTTYWYQVLHRPENLYIRGPMGLAPAVGLGVAVARPNRTVIVLEGDGSLMMSVSVLGAIAEKSPANLVLVCLDNGIYESGGRRKTVNAVRTDFCRIAEGFGIPRVFSVDTAEALDNRIQEILRKPACTFLHVKVVPISRSAPPPALKPFEIKASFLDAAGAPKTYRARK
jgi:sulfopyruvate decarboxylase subunit beta